jgi:hypothetical protein
MKQHCKVKYEVIVPYSDETLVEVVKVNGIEYKLDYLPRPCSTTSDLFCVFHNGVRFSTFAKFLKTVNQIN